MSRRVRLGHASILAAVVGVLVLAAPAAAKLRLRSVDASDYPTIRVTVVAPTKSTPAPRLREHAAPVQGFSVHRLQGKSVVLAIDRSTSMRGRPLERAVAAARAFVRAKPKDDRIGVVSFGSSALQLTSFSTATIDADGALRGLAVDTRQGTALHDAVALASRALVTEPTQARVLILLTDGRDISSSGTFAQAVAAAKADRVAVYSIGIQGRQFTPGPLQTLARETGGAYYPATTAGLTTIYNRIAGELGRTWVLEYVTAARPGDRLNLTVSARRGGNLKTAFVIPGSAGEQAAKGSGWRGPLIIGLIVGLLVFLGMRFLHGVSRWAGLRRRLGPYRGAEDASPGRRVFEPVRWRAILAPVYGPTERSLGHLGFWNRLERQLVRADLPFRTVEFFWLMLGCGAFLAFIAAVAGASAWLVVPLFVLGAIVPYVVVSIKAERRLKAVEAQLPDALNMMAGSLTAGHSFNQAIQTFVDSGGAPLDAEFGRVLTETRLGGRLETALQNMGERIGSNDLDFVIRAVIIQRNVGGSLAGLFELVAETVDKRHAFRLKVKSLTAMGRMSATVLIVLPFAVALLVTAVSHNYMAPLFDSGVGHVLLILGLTMMVIGTLILRRMVAFEG
jgi:VWFA-related protein